MVKKGYYKGLKVGSTEYWSYQYGKYLTKRIEVQQQGYELKEKMTKSEFKRVYKQSKDAEIKNIIRTMASEDKLINFELAQKIFKRETGRTFSFLTKNPADKAYFRKIISLDFITEKQQKETLEYFKNRYGRDYTAGNFKQYSFFKYLGDLDKELGPILDEEGNPIRDKEGNLLSYKLIAEEYYGY